MERLNSAILEKVSANAKAIVKEAEERAEQRIKAAQEQQRARFEEQKSKLLNEANAEAIRILAQAAIKGRQETLTAKTAVVNEVIDRANKQLASLAGNERVLANLIKEGIAILGADKVRAYVSSKDLTAMQKLVREDKELTRAVTEIRGQDCRGGVIIEDAEGKNRIDNTFETRLEMLLPRLLPEIGKGLF
jgi:vacuolar-type H+-ATPase subunit E/Vma4